MTRDFDFDPESGQFVPSPTATETLEQSQELITNPVSVEFVGVTEPLEETASFITPTDGVATPSTFYIAEQIIRTRPDGTTAIDVVVTVEDGLTNLEYEVRVS